MTRYEPVRWTHGFHNNNLPNFKSKNTIQEHQPQKQILYHLMEESLKRNLRDEEMQQLPLGKLTLLGLFIGFIEVFLLPQDYIR